jgi:peptide/nickel transport system permease protein
MALRRVAGAMMSGVGGLSAVIVLAFLMFRVLPGDPVRALTHGRPMTADQLATLRREYGLEESLPAMFGDYLIRLSHGDLGTSFEYRRPVTTLIADRLGPTVLLVGSAVALSALVGFTAGYRAAWRVGRPGQRIATVTAVGLWSAPSLWIGLMLITLFAVGVGPLPSMFPTGGIATPGVTGGLAVMADGLRHLALPCLTLVLVGYGQYLMVMRASLRATTAGAYLTTARAKGLREVLVRRRHALPNALLPPVTLLFVNLGGVVSGAVVVETVFSWPGLGLLFSDALTLPDLPLLQGLFIVFAGGMIALNTMADLIYPLLDPRVGDS